MRVNKFIVGSGFSFLILLAVYLFFHFSFSRIWDDLELRSNEISRIIFEFSGKTAVIDIKESNVVDYTVSRLYDSGRGLGENRVSICKIRLYSSSGLISSSRRAWLYSSPWSFHVLMDEYNETYVVFTFEDDLPDPLSRAFVQIEKRFQSRGSGTDLSIVID